MPKQDQIINVKKMKASLEKNKENIVLRLQMANRILREVNQAQEISALDTSVVFFFLLLLLIKKRDAQKELKMCVIVDDRYFAFSFMF